MGDGAPVTERCCLLCSSLYCVFSTDMTMTSVYLEMIICVYLSSNHLMSHGKARLDLDTALDTIPHWTREL